MDPLVREDLRTLQEARTPTLHSLCVHEGSRGEQRVNPLKCRSDPRPQCGNGEPGKKTQGAMMAPIVTSSPEAVESENPWMLSQEVQVASLQEDAFRTDQRLAALEGAMQEVISHLRVLTMSTDSGVR